MGICHPIGGGRNISLLNGPSGAGRAFKFYISQQRLIHCVNPAFFKIVEIPCCFPKMEIIYEKLMNSPNSPILFGCVHLVS